MKSIWYNDIELPKFPALVGNIKTKVLIVGGGIAGLLTAYFLKQKGVEYALVERSTICSGTTSRTTAKLTAQHGLIYSKMIRSMGIEKAQMYLAANRKALDKYTELCKKTDCDYEIKNNFVYSTDDRACLEREMAAPDKMGFKASLHDDLPLPIKTVGGVCFPDQAQFHPLKFLAFISKGLNIYENTFVRHIDSNKAFTDTGSITAELIVVTTHFPFVNKHGLFFLKLYQHRSYVLALKDAEDVGGMYVDESKTGLSFRNHNGLLLLGGGAHRTGKQGGNYDELRLFAFDKYPDSMEVCSWAAQDCMSLDNMPYIGRYSKSTPRILTASGFNKWGMSGAMLSAMLLCDSICGVKNEFSSLFDPSRSILKPQLAVNGAETVKNLLIPFGKRCPHMGCALKWNKAEHTWDCACHGSRFSSDGAVLDNPSNKNLKA